MKIAILCAVVALAGCGAVDVASPEPPQACADASASIPDATLATDAGPKVNRACLETDETIQICIAASAGGSWTAPETCVVDFVPGKPQRLVAGILEERLGTYCCGFVKVEGKTALCCADLERCKGDGG